MGNMCGSSKKDIPDPVTGLTDKERAVIVKSWKMIYDKNYFRNNVADFFTLLFTRHPEVLEQFKQFRGNNLDEMNSLNALNVHVISFFVSLALYVDNLGDPVVLSWLVHDFTKEHFTMKVTFQDMEKLREVFLVFLQGALAPEDPAPAINAWDKFFQFHNSMYQVIYKDLAVAGLQGTSNPPRDESFGQAKDDSGECETYV